MKTICAVLMLMMLTASAARGGQDVILADFEGPTYGDWKVEGTAFGSGPAQGTLPGQMAVTGFLGHGLANSFHGGDASTGTLTSPTFAIGSKYITFLIGGGGYEGKTCINLLIDGKVVRTAVGPNTAPGGSEALALAAWEVSDLAGKNAQIQIVDNATGGWGHINIDQIVMTDAKPNLIIPREREVAIQKPYLLFPVSNEGKSHRVSVVADGQTIHEFDIALADEPQWFAHLDVSAWKGKKLTIHVDKLAEDAKSLDLMSQSDAIWSPDALYHERLRAQLHFSPRRGWNNDPNGMVYADGLYHLYFQHNPYGWPWGNMHWGHAVSRDMVHWEELPIAIYPHSFEDMAYSGGAVVDKNNTSGWQTGAKPPIVATYTSTGRGECIAYSNDGGRSFAEFAGNPIIKNQGRDPRPLWYEPGKHWVIAVYDEFHGKQYIAVYTSPDLKAWTFQSRIEGFFECPDLFELPLGDKKYWVLTAANSEYMLGQFDGKTFTPETPKLPGHRGEAFYAAQTFSNEPQGRVVRIGWLQTVTPGMPFNQAMSLPIELGLRQTPQGARMSWTPVKELESLRDGADQSQNLANFRAELMELRAEFEPVDASTIQFTLRGARIVYDTTKHEISVNGHRAPAPLVDGKQRLTVYVDRTVVEVFASDGLTYVPMPFVPKVEDQSATIEIKNGKTKLTSLQIYKLKSIWDQN